MDGMGEYRTTPNHGRGGINAHTYGGLKGVGETHTFAVPRLLASSAANSVLELGDTSVLEEDEEDENTDPNTEEPLELASQMSRSDLAYFSSAAARPRM
jgi:hypothetical protein